jgi:hypothetical protein
MKPPDTKEPSLSNAFGSESTRTGDQDLGHSEVSAQFSRFRNFLAAQGSTLSAEMKVRFIGWLNDSWFAWIILAVGLLIFFGALAAEWRAVGAVVILLSIYPALPHRFRIWLRDYFFLYGAIFIIALASVFLILWLLTNLLIPAQQSVINTTLYPLNGTPVPEFKFGDPVGSHSLEARYPSLILADDQPAEFTLILRRLGSPTQSIAVSALIPPGVLLASSPLSREFAIEFPVGEVVTSTFGLISARTDTYLPWKSVPLTFTLYVSSTAVDTVALNFQTESAWGRTERDFVNSTVNEKSPLIILVAGLLSGAGLALSSFYRQQKEKTEIKKQEGSRKLQQFREAIKLEDRARARDALQQLDRMELSTESSAEREIAKAIWNLANATAETDMASLVRKAALAWPEECAHAYLMCHARLYKEAPAQLREAKSFLPLYQLQDKELATKLVQADNQLPIIQTLHWPNLVEPRSSITVAAAPFVQNVLKGYNPFPQEHAEDDQLLLFFKRGFWEQHALFDALKKCDHPHIVFGVAGSGRSAMAMALSKYNVTLGVQFNLFLSGHPDVARIRRGYAQHLLQSIQAYPTLLSRLGQAELALLARCLASVLGKEYVLAELRSLQASGQWLREIKDPDQRRYWQRIAEGQLALLSRAVEEAALGASDPYQWPHEFSRCAYSLGFDYTRALLVIDGINTSADWLGEILPNLYPWWQSGLVTILFLPQSLEAKVKSLDGITTHVRLEWTGDDLRQMVLMRFRECVTRNTRKPIEEIFESTAVLERLLGASDNNPQQFVRLWNACLRQAGGKRRLDAATLDAVLAQLE